MLAAVAGVGVLVAIALAFLLGRLTRSAEHVQLRVLWREQLENVTRLRGRLDEETEKVRELRRARAFFRDLVARLAKRSARACDAIRRAGPPA